MNTASPDARKIGTRRQTRISKMNIWLARYTKLLAVVTFFLIIAGGMVTSTGSGLAVPDWPLSYGQVMPPMVGGIFYEHGHRMIASLVGFMTLVFTIWCGITEKRIWLRRLSIAALGMVVAQGILGGLTVLFLLPAPISILHACIAQTFFATIIAIAYFYSKEWSQGSSNKSIETSILKKLLWLTITLIYLQLILGATVRHTDQRIAVIPHIIGAFLVIFHTIALSIYALKNFAQEKKLIYPAVFLGFLSLIQISLGMGSFVYTMMLPETVQPSAGRLFFVTSHQTLGALLLGTGVFLALRVYRFEKAAMILTEGTQRI